MKAGTSSIVIVLSGQTGSGKTSLARELVLSLNANFASFGSYVRSEATRRGIGLDRVSLQILGQTLIKEFGPDAFVEEVLSSGQGTSSAITILDGVRSIEIWHVVQKLASSCILAYLDIEEDERIKRLVQRDRLDAASIRLAMEHPLERGVPELRPYANLVLCNSSIDKMVSEIILLLTLKGIR